MTKRGRKGAPSQSSRSPVVPDKQGRLACSERQKNGCVLPWSVWHFVFRVHEVSQELQTTAYSRPFVRQFPGPGFWRTPDSPSAASPSPLPPYLLTCCAFSHDTQAFCCKHGVVRVSPRRGGRHLSSHTYHVQTTAPTFTALRFRLTD